MSRLVAYRIAPDGSLDLLRATWSGGRTRAAVRIEYLQDGAPRECQSHRGLAPSNFGEGIITWHVPYLFRTPAGYNPLAPGPANWPKDGASPLEGLIETDWAGATFTIRGLPWQGDYVRGAAPDGTGTPEHQTKLHLRGFEAIESEPAAHLVEE